MFEEAIPNCNWKYIFKNYSRVYWKLYWNVIKAFECDCDGDIKCLIYCCCCGIPIAAKYALIAAISITAVNT